MIDNITMAKVGLAANVSKPPYEKNTGVFGGRVVSASPGQVQTGPDSNLLRSANQGGKPLQERRVSVVEGELSALRSELPR